MHIGQFWPFSKCSHFSNIRCFLKRFLAHNNSNVVVESFFAPFWHFYFFNPNWPFCMGYSPCILANFGHFQNALIFRILGVFCSGFLHTTTLKWSYNHFSHLFGIFNFWPKLTICMGYSPCILANFGHFQNALIFRILGVFWSGFLHTTTLMWS